ncbi:MAG: hypothetical protein R3Y51_05770 [Rikenellaceae bacterium]
MKKLKYLAILCLMTFLSINVYSQRPANQNTGLQQMQLQVLVKQLQLNDSQRTEFSKIYNEYSEELKSLRPEHKQNENRRGEAPTDEQIETQILESFDITEKTTALKRKYFPRFKTVLSLRQILEMYNVERQISERVKTEFQHRNNTNR